MIPGWQKLHFSTFSIVIVMGDYELDEAARKTSRNRYKHCSCVGLRRNLSQKRPFRASKTAPSVAPYIFEKFTICSAGDGSFPGYKSRVNPACISTLTFQFAQIGANFEIIYSTRDTTRVRRWRRNCGATAVQRGKLVRSDKQT